MYFFIGSGECGVSDALFSFVVDLLCFYASEYQSCCWKERYYMGGRAISRGGIRI